MSRSFFALLLIAFASMPFFNKNQIISLNLTSCKPEKRKENETHFIPHKVKLFKWNFHCSSSPLRSESLEWESWRFKEQESRSEGSKISCLASFDLRFIANSSSFVQFPEFEIMYCKSAAWVGRGFECATWQFSFVPISVYIWFLSFKEFSRAWNVRESSVFGN